MYPFGDQKFGYSEVPWIEIPCAIDQVEDFQLRADAAGLRHRLLYHAKTDRKNHPGQVMLVRVPNSPSGENWDLVASYARRVVRGEFAAIDIPDILVALRRKAVIPRDPTASSTWLDTAPGTGARDVERALFASLGTSSADVTRDALKIIGLYLTRLSYAQKSLNLDHDGYQTIQWLTENWHRGDARSVYLLYHPDEATEDDSRKNYWWEDATEVARKRLPGRNEPMASASRHSDQRALTRSVRDAVHSDLPWRIDRQAQSHPKQGSRTLATDVEAVELPNALTRRGLDQATDHEAPKASHQSRTTAQERTKEPPFTDGPDRHRIGPAQTRNLLRRLTAKSRQRAAKRRPHELVWKSGKTVQGVTSEVAELADGTTLSLVTGRSTSALFHGATPVASGSADQLHVHASNIHKHVDARKHSR